MPLTENKANGYTSVCCTNFSVSDCSSALPGIAETRGAKASRPGSILRSVKSKKATTDKTRIRPCRNRAGPSQAIAPSAITPSVLPAKKSAANAINSPPKLTTSCARNRAARGKKASTRTPSNAATSTISTGARFWYSSCGTGNSPCVAAGRPIMAWSPSWIQQA